eukprot:GCRY01001100.1.p1 GENE.GCRY01001100.1~~GCRY01001100.1.p1  ORF type:complete len:187 (+),score=36.41 GCRY01001100.1:100-660(+)
MAQAQYIPSTFPDPPQTELTLFYIQRSKNSNLVVYFANANDEGVFDDKTPVTVEWYNMFQMKDPKYDDLDAIPKEGLNALENKMAYGIKCEKKDDEVEATVVSLKKRKMLIRKAAEKESTLTYGDKKFEGKTRKFVAECDINNKRALLKSIYVQAKETMFLPKVAYVVLFGYDLETGEEVHEKIDN